MQKKLLATVVASLVSSQAMAVEVYNDDTSSLSIGGRIGFNTEKSNGSDTAGKNDSARINFKFAHKFDNGWTGHGVAEWGFNADDEYVNGEKQDTFNNRLGYVALSNDSVGSITAGKNWSVTYDVSGWTDSYAIGGGSAMGIYDGRAGGDFDGTARADDALQYRGSFHGLNVGVQYQLSGNNNLDNGVNNNGKIERKDGYGIALSYDLPMGLSVGAAYSETRYDDFSGATYEGQDKSKSATAGVKFENEMLYAAAMYGQFRNKTSVDTTVTDLDRKSTGIEVYGRLQLPQVVDGFALEAGYNQLDANKQQNDTDSDAQLQEYMLGAVYTTGPMQFAFEWANSNTKNHAGDKDKNDTYTLQARYYF